MPKSGRLTGKLASTRTSAPVRAMRAWPLTGFRVPCTSSVAVNVVAPVTVEASPFTTISDSTARSKPSPLPTSR